MEKTELMETEVKSQVNEGCKVLGIQKSVMSCRTLGMEAKRGLSERVVLPTVLYRAETWGVRAEERRRLNVFEMKCLRSMAGVTLRDMINNDVVRFRTGIMKKLEERGFEKVWAHGEDGCKEIGEEGVEGGGEWT